MELPPSRVSSLFALAPSLVLVGLFFFLALIYRQRDLALLSLLVLIAVGGLKLWSWLSLQRIECRMRTDKQKVFAGETLLCEFSVGNGKLLPVWLELRASINGFIETSSEDNKLLTAETGLLWYERADFQWDLTAERRGVHEIGPFHVASGDLFGFFPNQQKVEAPVQVVVYPRLVPLTRFLLPKRDFFGAAGSGSPVKDPVYILGTTDYQNGRPAKYIHWKASARHHRLQEKLFEPTEQEKVLLVVEVDRFANLQEEEPFERTLEVVASMAVRMDRKGRSVGLLTNGTMVGINPQQGSGELPQAKGAARGHPSVDDGYPALWLAGRALPKEGATRAPGAGSPFLPVTRNPAQLATILENLARLQAVPKEPVTDLIKVGLAIPWGISCVYFAFEESALSRIACEHFRGLRIPVSFITYDAIDPMSKENKSFCTLAGNA
jgi:uncharacterized protein (DUF58 family)